MKKNIFINLKRTIILFLLFFTFSSHITYAEKLDYCSEIEFSGWYVSIDDIYALREEYEKNPNLETNEARDFLIKRAENYKKDMNYINNQYQHGYGGGNVFLYEGDTRYRNYYISNFDTSSSHLGPGPIYLYATVSNEYVQLNLSKEELNQFFERNNKWAEEFRTVCEYVRNYLKENEYSGVYFKYLDLNEYSGAANGIVYVGLSDKSKATILEEKGIAWEFSEFYQKSREDMHHQLQYLWENREELKIVEVMEVCNQVIISGLDSDEEFRANTQGRNLEDCHYQKAFELWGIDERLKEIRDWSKVNELQYFILRKREDEPDWGEKFWKELEVWLEYMKKLYPKYSYENLFHMAYVSRDKNYYTDFDTELEKFAETLPYIKNQKNPFDENEFGDSEHLVLKALLKNCKELYPEKEYAQLYDSYAKEVNESDLYTAEEKRNRFVWRLLQVEKELETLHKLDNNEILAYFGFGVLIVACGIFAIYKNKKL